MQGFHEAAGDADAAETEPTADLGGRLAVAVGVEGGGCDGSQERVGGTCLGVGAGQCVDEVFVREWGVGKPRAFPTAAPSEPIRSTGRSSVASPSSGWCRCLESVAAYPGAPFLSSRSSSRQRTQCAPVRESRAGTGLRVLASIRIGSGCSVSQPVWNTAPAASKPRHRSAQRASSAALLSALRYAGEAVLRPLASCTQISRYE